nr:MAG TPA: GIY-YIG nuclease superfamily protein [Crassvirales sp.]
MYRKINAGSLKHIGDDYVVYEHFISNTKEVFYVGSGTKTRAYSLYPSSAGRPKEWKDIILKNKCDVSIVAENLSKEEAKELESNLINKYKRKIDGGTLVNLATYNNKRSEGELGRPILLFNCFGTFIKEFSSASIAAKQGYGTKGDIGKCAKEPIINGILNRNTGTGKWLWRYKDSYNPKDRFIGRLSGTGNISPVGIGNINNNKFILEKIYLSCKLAEKDGYSTRLVSASSVSYSNGIIKLHKGKQFIKYIDFPDEIKDEVIKGNVKVEGF